MQIEQVINLLVVTGASVGFYLQALSQKSLFLLTGIFCD